MQKQYYFLGEKLYLIVWLWSRWCVLDNELVYIADKVGHPKTTDAGGKANQANVKWGVLCFLGMETGGAANCRWLKMMNQDTEDFLHAYPLVMFPGKLKFFFLLFSFLWWLVWSELGYWFGHFVSCGLANGLGSFWWSCMIRFALIGFSNPSYVSLLCFRLEL